MSKLPKVKSGLFLSQEIRYPNHIVVTPNHIVDFDDIVLIRTHIHRPNYIEVITSSDKRYINRISLVKTMKLLPSDIFHYNKKSFIVNKARIKRFALNFKYAYVSIEDMEISIPVDSDSDFVKKFKDDYLDI